MEVYGARLIMIRDPYLLGDTVIQIPIMLLQVKAGAEKGMWDVIFSTPVDIPRPLLQVATLFWQSSAC